MRYANGVRERLCGGCHLWLAWCSDLFYVLRARTVGGEPQLDPWCKQCRRRASHRTNHRFSA